MPFFSKVFRSKDSAAKKQVRENGLQQLETPKPRWDDAWQRQDVEPEEVQELLRECTVEIRSRGLDLPFLLLPFRPASDPSAARTFIRNYFGNGLDTNKRLQGEDLAQELRLVEPLVLCSVVKWCWSRLPGGVVTWEAYELFKIGEQDSNSARDAFATFVPISVASDARSKIIFDFFELLAAIAAHGKTNGLGGLKLSRYAGWWAFEHADSEKGFDQGYRTWESAADATSHLFLAYLRSLSPDSVKGKNGISSLPRSLQFLLETTEYPPHPLSHHRTAKVVMIVESVSPTPFALLRRTKHFEYRDDDAVLQRFSDYEDPVKALTEECRRVLKSISSTNDSSTSKASTSIKDPSWSRFEDIGFGELGEESDDDAINVTGLTASRQQPPAFGSSRSKNDGGRPTTPSWADFLSSGFIDDAKNGGPTHLLPPDKVLPPINTRGQSSQSHKRMTDNESILEPGELANITTFDLDETFWWVWITSLAGEETSQRKAAFGRCALIETRINNGTWLLVEEIIKGAAPEPDANAYVAEKKSRFGFSRRGKLSRSKSSAKGALPTPAIASKVNMTNQPSKTSIAPDQHARIQAAAAALQQKHLMEEANNSPRRARKDDDATTKTNSVLTLQPVMMSEAAPAMKWASSYDKNVIRAKYLGDNFAGRGSATDLLSTESSIKPDPTPKGSIAPPTPVKDVATPSQQPLSPPATGEQKSLAQAAQQPLPPTPKDENKILGGALPATPLPRTESKSNVVQTEMYPRPMERQEGPPQPPIKTQAPPATLPVADPPHSPKSAATEPIAASPPSPENAKSDRNKLKKKPVPNTFKGLFNRKKVGEEPARPTAKPAYASTGSSSAVAAARAALEAKAARSTEPPPPPQSKVTNKRFSTVGKGAAVEEKLTLAGSSRGVPEVPGLTPQAAKSRPISTTDTADYTEYASTVDPNEAQHAEREFRTFDQGPLADQPAFVPQDSPRQSEDQKGLEFIPVNEDPRFTSQEAAPNRGDDVSEVSMEPVTEAPSTDRWAQIRKNAAERAARMSEEQSRQTDRTDDGDTSGEETIESRVARIKARVAELTGNMDNDSATRPRP